MANDVTYLGYIISHTIVLFNLQFQDKDGERIANF